MPFSELINGPATVTARHFLLPAGEVGGWHYHPGGSFNVVKQGTVTVEDGCGGEDVFTAGQAFEKLDGRIHRASNLGTSVVEEYNMFIHPEGQPTTVTFLSADAALHSVSGNAGPAAGWILPTPEGSAISATAFSSSERMID